MIDIHLAASHHPPQHDYLHPVDGWRRSPDQRSFCHMVGASIEIGKFIYCCFKASPKWPDKEVWGLSSARLRFARRFLRRLLRKNGHGNARIVSNFIIYRYAYCKLPICSRRLLCLSSDDAYQGPSELILFLVNTIVFILILACYAFLWLYIKSYAKSKYHLCACARITFLILCFSR